MQTFASLLLIKKISIWVDNNYLNPDLTTSKLSSENVEKMYID